MSANKYLILLGRAIREVREQHGLSANDLAAATGVAPTRVSAMEDGQLDPDYELLTTLAKAMSIHPAAFFLQAEAISNRDAASADGS